MEGIVWINKTKTGCSKKTDISIYKISRGVSILVRNGWQDKITDTGHIRFGFSPSDSGKLFFMPADSAHGWGLHIQNSSTDNLRATVTDRRYVEKLLEFVGDYDMEVSEDDICFIDRKNAL